MDMRALKGLALAATARPEFRRPEWRVPSSQSGHAPYWVDLKAGLCSCADFELTGRKCKHLHAALWTSLNKGKTPEFPKRAKLPEEKAYPRKDSRLFNAIQTNEKEMVTTLLRDLCDGIAEPPRVGPKGGRPRMLLSDMVFSMVMKVYGMQSTRRSASDMRGFTEKTLLNKTPHHNTVFKYFEDANLAPVLQDLISRSAAPLSMVESDFAADSSGFSTSSYTLWNDEKWGSLGKTMKEQIWLKLHIMTGVKTNIITSAVVADKDQHDSPFFPELLNKTSENFTMNEVSADKAYISIRNLEAVTSHGATPFIPFKTNATKAGGKGSEIWEKMFGYFQYKRREFLEHYHKRSNVEATFWMIKAKFGERLRSRSRVAQENELLCKVLCHNLAVLVGAILELGVSVEFWGEGREAA